MSIRILLLSFLLLYFFLPSVINTEEPRDLTLYSTLKFFVKTKAELRISEATGEISVYTGISSLDERNIKYKVKKIKKLFKVNNGDIDLYNELGMGKIYVFYLEEMGDIAKIVEDYGKDVNIEFAEPNYIGFAAGAKETGSFIPNDKFFAKQWYLNNSGNIYPSSQGIPKVGADIDMLRAWEIEQGSEEIIIAILDSGFRYDFLDLKNKVWINKKEIPNNGKDDDGNGYIDDYYGWDFANDDNFPNDGFGHGTNIASVIGAELNNEIGFAGISKSKLMNCKNLSEDNTGEYEWWAESIKYAVDNGAKIINMSEGGSDYSNILKAAIDYALKKNVLVVAAMMNYNNGKNYYPAALNGVIAIGATDTDDRRCKKFTWGGGSCWGKHIFLVAPGNKIYGLDYQDQYSGESYWSGTSQSTAIVSAIASLLLAQDKTCKPDDIKKILKETAKDGIGDPYEDKAGWDPYYGWGRVDAYAALNYKGANVINNKSNNPSDENKRQTTEENNKKREINTPPIEQNGDRGRREEIERKPPPRR
ncbi:MAG: S8 family serine peptidase [Ignavibacteria bacterium]